MNIAMIQKVGGGGFGSFVSEEMIIGGVDLVMEYSGGVNPAWCSNASCCEGFSTGSDGSKIRRGEVPRVERS